MNGSSGLAWSVGKGITAALRRADETPSAWQGFRPLQFTAPVGSGAGGGPLVDSQVALLGSITKGIAPGSGRWRRGQCVEVGDPPPARGKLGNEA
jgi:S1-C subfamily serine protease